MKNGKLLDEPVANNKVKLLVPLNSAIIGQLNQKFLPGSSLGRMVIHVTLNRYAFFLSGISNQYDGMNLTTAQHIQSAQVPRSWKIKSLKLVMDTYRYGDEQNLHL
jgi:hypothetical protein